MFALAKKYDGRTSPCSSTTWATRTSAPSKMYAVKAIETGMQGRVTAQHCRAMALYEENYFRKVVALMKQAGVGLVSDPQTAPPLHARVKDLLAAGVNVALGQG